eukprot:gene15644-11193_t
MDNAKLTIYNAKQCDKLKLDAQPETGAVAAAALGLHERGGAAQDGHRLHLPESARKALTTGSIADNGHYPIKGNDSAVDALTVFVLPTFRGPTCHENPGVSVAKHQKAVVVCI